MKTTKLITALVLTAALAGCKKSDDNRINLTNAIDNYYAAHPDCLWSKPKQFPAQADSGDATKTQPYDALVDQGLLVRTIAEKRVLILASKSVNNYDLSDKGRSAWTADATQPGYGNFCYGHRKVSSIDFWSPTTNDPGATTNVQYHYAVAGTPDWAINPEMQTAYPALRVTNTNPLSGTNKVTLTSNGWQINPAAISTDPDANLVR